MQEGPAYTIKEKDHGWISNRCVYKVCRKTYYAVNHCKVLCWLNLVIEFLSPDHLVVNGILISKEP